MRITEKPATPPPPPPPNYVVEFTFEELVLVGVMSHRHDVKADGCRGCRTLYACLPDRVKAEASRRAGEMNRAEHARGMHRGVEGWTINSVDFGAQP